VGDNNDLNKARDMIRHMLQGFLEKSNDPTNQAIVASCMVARIGVNPFTRDILNIFIEECNTKGFHFSNRTAGELDWVFTTLVAYCRSTHYFLESQNGISLS
jgi:hypothetical protein